MQSASCDLVSALDHVKLVLNTFRKIRENVSLEFKDIFETAQGLLSIVDETETLKIPRTVSRQQHRANVNASDPENFYRIVVMIPLLDDFITQFETRFEDHKTVLSSLYILIPSILGKSKTKFNEENFKFYKRFLDWDTLKAEFLLWKTKCHEQPEAQRSKNAITALGDCSKDLFPNIHRLLKILATLPVSTCTPERTFSTMKRLKTFLRNSTGEDRLTGLALMSIILTK